MATETVNVVVDLSQKRGNTLYVDAVFGNDGTALPDRADLPYLTIVAARDAATAVDTIKVRPGIYDEYGLVKNGIVYDFDPGAKVICTGTPIGVLPGIFTTELTDVVDSFRVDGSGHFEWAGGSSGYVALWKASDSVVRINADHVESNGADIFGSDTGTNVDIIMRARTGIASADAFYCANPSGEISMRIDQITSGTSLIISEGEATFNVYADSAVCNKIGSITSGVTNIYAKTIEHSFAGRGISHEGGIARIVGAKITATHNDGYLADVYADGLEVVDCAISNGVDADGCFVGTNNVTCLGSRTDIGPDSGVLALGDLFYDQGGPTTGQVPTANPDGTWSWAAGGGGAVDSVNGQTGAVDLDTSDIDPSTDRNYVTDAQQTVIGNTSGTNTGDQTNISGNAATVTTNANLTGPVTSVGNATAIADAALSIAKTSGLQTALDALKPLPFNGMIEAPVNKTYVVCEAAPFAFTINTLIAKLQSGTLSAAIQINGTPVTGINTLAVTSTQGTGTATAANTVSVGQRVTLVVTSASAPNDLAYTLKYTR